ITTSDTKMAETMAQMGFGPAETIVAGDAKQVSMHFQMPALGKTDDFELRTVSRNGRFAKKWFSPAKDRILAAQDASAAKALLDIEKQTAKSLAQNIASGPMGWVSSGVQAGSAALSAAMVVNTQKKAHEFWEWECKDASGGAQQARRDEPPPLTD